MKGKLKQKRQENEPLQMRIYFWGVGAMIYIQTENVLYINRFQFVYKSFSINI